MRIDTNYQSLILLLLWLSGMLKAFFYTYIFEADLVLIAISFAALDALVQLVNGIKRPKETYFLGLLLIMGFYFYLLFSIFYSSSPNYSFEKSISFIPNIFFFLYSAFIIKINLRLFIRLYAGILIPLAIFFIYMKSIVWTVDSEATQMFKDLRNHYLAIGLHLGLLFFLCWHYLRKLWLIIILLFLLVASSARGALIFTILTFVITEFKSLGRFTLRKKHIKFIIASFFLILPLAIVFRAPLFKLLETSINRFAVLFEGGGVSTNERIIAMKFAVRESFSSFENFLFGHGVGSFGIEFTGTDFKAYPHNLFLELIFELGIIGLLLILALLILAFYCANKSDRLLMALLVFVFLNVMKSFSLIDLWILFSIVGLILNRTKLKQTLIN